MLVQGRLWLIHDHSTPIVLCYATKDAFMRMATEY